MVTSHSLRTMMVDTQVRPSDVTKFPIIKAMLDTPREAFVPNAQTSVAYMDAPIPLGSGRELMEARTLAKMLDALDIQVTDEVLIVGGGLGYSAAILAQMAQSVVMVEEDEAMVHDAEAALTSVEADNAVVLAGPLAEGAAKAGPFDVIMIDGAIETLPTALPAQLREGGRIAAIFQKGALGEVRVGQVVDGHLAWRFAFNASAPVLPGFAANREFQL
ncbi:protein-L-isoaspartate(D-aspartate) O-methyltransferase [Jannaschia pohangensis]|uniref:Protein-L-isoaspartate O-methyltransferase n=2 Tax=Jannaschia pohangensis TaxID=390807 RepID=A0A1I3SIP5_9RHOB|nr:protein-L-isoaspartate(D-aspartate) O-methyltransferase [Jannaschia pohangensis]